MLATTSITAYATSPSLGAEAYNEDSSEIVLYEEDFDDYTGTVAFGNGIDYETGWIYSRKSSNSQAYIQDGKLYFCGSGYDILYRDGGSTWGNYTVEADLCYTTTSGWGGLLYNVQSDSKYEKCTPILSSQQIVLNGNNSGWVNDSYSLNWKSLSAAGVTGTIQLNTPFRMKISVSGTTATAWIAFYGDNNVLGAYQEVLSISNIPKDMQTGSIGIMSSGQGTYNSFWIDNIRVTATSNVIFTEDFSGYSDQQFSSGDNTAVGIHFQQYSSGTTAGIEDGHMYLNGSNSSYDQIHFLTGMNWTNYTVEADMCYENSSGWAGLLYRTASETSSQKATLSAAWKTLNGYTSKGGWYNDTLGISKVAVNNNWLQVGEPFRMKVVAHENSAALYYAVYDEQGNLGEYTFAMSIADNFYEEHLTGSIGLMVSSGGNCQVWIDNIVVSRGADRFLTPANVADIYIPDSGIVNPPVVIQEINSASSYASLAAATPAVALLEIDSSLNIISNEAIISSVSDFMTSYRSTVIPAFWVDSTAEVTAITGYMNDNNIIDAYVVADSENADLLYAARLSCPAVRGVLVFDSLSTATAKRSAYMMANDYLANVIMTDTPLTVDDVTYFNTRSMSTWCYALNAADVYSAIANGYSGVITSSASTVYSVYSSITTTTISGRPIPIAHRGHSSYPENTNTAYRKALEGGMTAVEIDLRLSKDNEIVLMHDPTIDRTTNGSGSISSFTVEELKTYVVDSTPGMTDEIPTLEEVFEEFADTDLVFYCHFNVTNDVIKNRFNELVAEYGYQDRVLVFIDHSMITTWNHSTMTDGIGFVSAHFSDLLAPTDDLHCIEYFISDLSPYNWQTMFYSFAGHMTEVFYYSLAARGYTSNHSTTNTQSDLNSRLLTGVGATGVLTDYPARTQGYYYYVMASDTTYEVGSPISMQQTALKIYGQETVACGFVQIGGTSLVAADGGYTLTEPGAATVVYYADVTVEGASYRIYSTPVVLSFSTTGA